MDMQSDDERSFDPDLPNGFKETDQTIPAKDLAIKSVNTEVDEGKSEKKVPESTTKSNTESSEASKLKTSTDAPQSSQTVVNVESSSGSQDKADKLQLEQSLHMINMITKKDCKDNRHLKSWRYFLPESPAYHKEGCKSGLNVSLATMANWYPCGANYQWCHSKVPMIRFCRTQINDLGPMRIQYWDNFFLLTKDGYPIGIKILTETDVEWLNALQEEEKTILDNALDDEANLVWGTITIPYPAKYLNIGLYFVGHLDSDTILPYIGRVVPLRPSETDELVKEFSKLVHSIPPKHVSELQMIVVNPSQEVNTLMDEGEIQQTPRVETADPTLLLPKGQTKTKT